MLDDSRVMQPLGQRRWLILVATCLTMLIISISTTSTLTALVVMSHDLDIHPATLPWVLNAYTLAAASFLLFGGRISVLLGPFRVYLAGNILLMFSSMAVALAPDAAVVLGSRAVQGLCLAMLAPNNVVICKQAFPKKEQLLAIGFLGGVAGLGFALGPILGGVLTHCLSWRFIFWFNIPLLATALILARLSGFQSPASREPFMVDWAGAGFLAAGLSGVLMGLSATIRNGCASSWVWIPSAAGLISLFLFVARERRAHPPLLNLGLLKNRFFDVVNINFGLTYFSISGFLYFFNLFTQNAATLNYSAAQSGLALLPFGLPFFIMSFLTQAVTTRWGIRLPLAGAFLLATAGFIWMALLPAQLIYQDLFIPLLFCGMGLGLATALLPGIAVDSVEPQEAGVAGGLMYTLLYFFASLSTVLGTILYVQTGRHEIIAAVAATGLPMATEAQIDKVILGHMSSVQDILSLIQPDLKAVTLNILRLSASASYASVMWLFTAACLAAGTLSLLFLGQNRREQ
ncbi:MAG: MFS transporter [Lentisphaerota bacterium]